jgi:hypothetical protein
MRLHRCSGLVIAVGVVAAWPGVGRAQLIIHNESTNGDLSNSQGAPTPFVLVPGDNRVIGSVNGFAGDSTDWLSVTVPAGTLLTSYVNAAYASTDSQGFTGFANGLAFEGNPGVPAAYRGYAHFGTFASNGSLPVANTVGTDMFDIMTNPNAYFPGQEPQGFTQPLGAGSYTFLIQQLGSATGYEFNFQVAVVPEPSSLALAGVAGLIGFAQARRRRPA